jgi:hypothetical protein
MSLNFQPQKPRFEKGQRVVVVGPGVHRHKNGTVIQVLDHSGDYVYRFRVHLSDGITALFFGFELKAVTEQPA